MRDLLRLFGVASSDIDDVLQDVLIATHRALDRFDASRYANASAPPVWGGEAPSLIGAPPPQPLGGFRARRGWDPLYSWLFGIAWRQVSHYRERAYRRYETPMGLHDKPLFMRVDRKPDLEEGAITEARSALVRSMLARLPVQRRVMLVMHDMLDIPVVDIARELGMNENTAQNRLRLARQDFVAAARRLTPEQRSLLQLGARPLHVASGPPRRR